MFDVTLQHTRLLHREGEWDVSLARGHVVEVAAKASAPAQETIDVGSRLLIPGFVDAHVHLDKAFLDENPALRGTTGLAFFSQLAEAKRASSREHIKARMRRALEAASRNGTTTMRAQIDVDDVVDLRGFEAAMALKHECAEWITLQVLVFPQGGVVGNLKAGGLVREALRLGGEVIGGGPIFDSAPAEQHLDALFDLAREFDRDVDVHIDLTTAPDKPLAEWELAHVARRTREYGLQGRVTVAHLTQVGQMSRERAAEVADLLVEAGIHVTVVPAAELNTARSWEAEPAREIDHAMTNVELLLRRGVNVAYSTGHLADSFNPYGDGDMLLDGLVLTCARNLGDPVIGGVHVLSLGTERPARTVGLPGPHGVESGAIADLVVLDESDPGLALRRLADRWLVIKAGRPVVRNRRTTEAVWKR